MTNDSFFSNDIQLNKTLPTLVSFALCPFVQRSVITLNIKETPFDRIYIDLAKPPEWFLALVPTGKVPALLFNDDVLFESAVINEYIDENSEQRLQQKSHWQRAQERAWISFVDELISDQYMMLVSSDEEKFEEERSKVFSKLKRLANKAGSRYFSDDSFGLLDAAIAPVFTRLKLTPEIYQDLKSSVGEDSNLVSWIENLTALKAVKESIVDDFDEQFIAYFEKENSYALKMKNDAMVV